jgi:hypothetical protein
MTPFLATHYDTAAAIAQKIHALAGRTEPQARDVFDLNLLFARTDSDPAPSQELNAHLPDAIEHALGLSYDEYVAKVIAYLDPIQRELYESRAAWDAMLQAVVSKLDTLR